MSDVPFDPEEEDEEWEDPELRARTKCTIFLSYTSNLISSGIRETILFLVKHKMVDCVVTTAGGIEEDFIKCLAPTYLGSFGLKGKDLREKGVNRIGNLLVPNNNYCLFEDWFSPILKAMTREQVEDGKVIYFSLSFSFSFHLSSSFVDLESFCYDRSNGTRNQ